ncbi:type IV secretion system protein [Asticcacaulis sp. DW145]|uniref:Type IV secretion system protein n=1 Tax=Asticcacaulis currens TaxID=2984210 RepID=A0ABT5IBU7_9CAUL|nr:type IV secretion system protein [Asticcacaulis currens]MDC7693310.1 type IV secretion system protein [Asticcacaulis currens]BEV10666.1 type IV secretion system protein [Asticcacaulis sp. DW145]
MMPPPPATCPGMPLSGDTGISGALMSVDCQIGRVVEDSFGRLFGDGGYLGTALTFCLTLYIAFLAFGLITGRTRLTLTTMTPKVLAIGLVLTFVTAWPAYQTVVYNLLTRGPDEIAAALTGSDEGASAAFAKRLDVLFLHFADAATAFEQTSQASPTAAPTTAPSVQNPQPVAPPIRNGKSSASDMLWSSGLILLLSTVGVLVLSRLILTLLLALGPLFVVFALFTQTRGLFEGWLRTSIGFAFIPMLVTLGGSAALSLLTPAILAISGDPMQTVRDIQPIVILFMGSVIYAAFLIMLMVVAFNIVKNWNPLRGRGDSAADVQAAAVTSAAVIAAAGGSTLITQGGGTTGPGGRSSSRDTRVQTVTTTLSSAPQAGQLSGGVTRRQGLGQRFRSAPGSAAPSSASPKTPPTPTPLSKAPGS